MNRLQTKFLGVDFKNPIVTSSGCFGFGMEYKEYFDPNILGGIGIKGLTVEPRDGNYGTRIAETPAGMLNSSRLPILVCHCHLFLAAQQMLQGECKR